MADVTCDCGQPVPDNSYLCTGCTRTLRTALAALHDAAEDLDHTLIHGTKASAQPGGPSARGSEKLPYNASASTVAWEAINTLTAWADEIAAVRGYYRPLNTLTALSAFIASNVDWLRHRTNAADALDEIHAQSRRVVHVIDRPVDRWFAGPCWAALRDDDGTARLCNAELYAREHAATVTCPDCGAEYDLQARRAWLLQQAEDHLVHAALAARALTALGAKLPTGTVYSWVSRGRLTSRDVDRYRRPLYRLGDVLDVLRDEARRKTGKADRTA